MKLINMNATAKEKKALCDKNYQHKNKDRLNKKRVERYLIEKNRNLLTRPASAVYLGLTTQKLANIVNFGKYWKVKEHLSDKGVVQYHKKDLDDWRLRNPQYYDEWELIKRGYYIMSKDFMTVNSWFHASKHVTEYCNQQRLKIASNKYWGEI